MSDQRREFVHSYLRDYVSFSWRAHEELPSFDPVQFDLAQSIDNSVHEGSNELPRGSTKVFEIIQFISVH